MSTDARQSRVGAVRAWPSLMVRSLGPLTLIATLLFACRAPTERNADAVPGNDDTTHSERAQPPADPSGDSAAAGATAAGASPPPALSIVTDESLDVAGASRRFVLATPRTYSPSRSYALILVLHGDGGSGPSMRAGFPLDDIAGEDAFVAYPTGTEGWNLYTPASQNNDLAFLVALVDDLKGRFSIDEGRVFGTGFSSGGFMVNQVACRRPSFFRAIVPQSGGAPEEPEDKTASTWDNGYTRCTNQTWGTGPAVMVIHGTSDHVVTPDSGAFTASYWSYVNACADSRTATSPSPCVQQDGCASGQPVLYCAIANLDHSIWSDALSATWQFFRSL